MKMKMTAAQSSKRQSLSTTVLFRTMFTWAIMLNLLITPFSLILFFSDKVMLLQLWRRKCTFLEAAVEVVLVGSTVTPLVIQFT